MTTQRAIKFIVIHCSATASGKPLRSKTENAAQVIDRWHKERGFKRAPAAVRSFSTGLAHIGYHYVIDTNGLVINGRSLDEAGAHVRGFNESSIGICMVGGVEKTGQYTQAQWDSLRELVTGHATTLNIPLVAASFTRKTDLAGICGHRDLSTDLNEDGAITPNEWLKTCPGFSVREWLANGLVPLAQHVCKERA